MSVDQSMTQPVPLPPGGDPFWSPLQPIDPAPSLPAEIHSALEKLGPSPFPKSGFPFLGFLATVYDHVASHVRQNGCK